MLSSSFHAAERFSWLPRSSKRDVLSALSLSSVTLAPVSASTRFTTVPFGPTTMRRNCVGISCVSTASLSSTSCANSHALARCAAVPRMIIVERESSSFCIEMMPPLSASRRCTTCPL